MKVVCENRVKMILNPFFQIMENTRIYRQNGKLGQKELSQGMHELTQHTMGLHQVLAMCMSVV